LPNLPCSRLGALSLGTLYISAALSVSRSLAGSFGCAQSPTGRPAAPPRSAPARASGRARARGGSVGLQEAGNIAFYSSDILTRCPTTLRHTCETACARISLPVAGVSFGGWRAPCRLWARQRGNCSIPELGLPRARLRKSDAHPARPGGPTSTGAVSPIPSPPRPPPALVLLVVRLVWTFAPPDLLVDRRLGPGSAKDSSQRELGSQSTWTELACSEGSVADPGSAKDVKSSLALLMQALAI